MSTQTRAQVATSKSLIFRSNTQMNDILSVTGVQTQLVAFLEYMLKNGAIMEVTAVKSDHSDDSSLGQPEAYCGTHAHGWAIDCWPLSEAKEGAYLDPEAEEFQHFLRLATRAPFFMQIGLAGTANTELNMLAAGPSGFVDDGADHCHLGTQTD